MSQPFPRVVVRDASERCSVCRTVIPAFVAWQSGKRQPKRPSWDLSWLSIPVCPRCRRAIATRRQAVREFHLT